MGQKRRIKMRIMKMIKSKRRRRIRTSVDDGSRWRGRGVAVQDTIVREVASKVIDCRWRG
jgi:hypothetical protein